MQKGFVFPKR